MTEHVKVLLVSTHPVQYGAPLYRRYARDPRLDLTVAYCSLQGAEPGLDLEFGERFRWDVPLLSGYRWIHPPNRSPRPNVGTFLGLVNPGLWNLVRRRRFDVVVCFGYRSASSWIAALAARSARAALVLTTDAHTLAPRDGRKWKGVAKRLILPWIFRWADATFAPSSRTVRFLHQLRVPDQDIFLTPFVVDTEFFGDRAEGADRQGTRESWGIPNGAPVALYCGKLVPWKRPGDLLEAAAQIEELHVVLVGEGSLRPALEDRASGSDLVGRVRFLGFANQRALPNVYAAADVLVLPSSHEPFGVVVNEAFACGVPAVVTDACGAAGDLVRDGETGYVVPVGDPETLANRLRMLIQDDQLRRRMGVKARARIAEWGPDQNAAAFADACLTLAGRWR